MLASPPDTPALREAIARMSAAPQTLILVEPDFITCRHNREIDPDTGECADCGEVLP